MRIAVIGLGGIAEKAYLPLLAGWSGLELVLHCRTGETIEGYQAEYRVRHGSTDFEQVVAFEPDAAFVLTPADTHYDIASRLLRADVDVYVEKPATLYSEQTQALDKLARARDRVLMVGFNRRYAPLHRRARELWAGRPVGFCVMEKHRPVPRHPDLHKNYIEDTIHIIDLLRFFCGDAEALETEVEMEDGKVVRAVSTLAIRDGGRAVVATERRAGAWQERYALHGGGASLYVDAFSRLRFIDGEREWIERETYASAWTSTLKGRGFEDEIAHFLRCVRERRTPRTSAQEALRTQRLVETMVARAEGERS